MNMNKQQGIWIRVFSLIAIGFGVFTIKEDCTLIAMRLRTRVWAGIALLARRLLASRVPDGDTL
ncbi:MAG TPA: hypothetical protein PKH39_18620 [Woeseiaceae bacterium]|nr:hypothetical protein [Woeseiaceae bacterium]